MSDDPEMTFEALPSLAFRDGAFSHGTRNVPAETAVAISINGSTHAVMMATPDHIRDLAIGLALNEAIVTSLTEIERIEVEAGELGIDCRLWLVESRASTYTARRRQMTGPVGCGLCGVESLELANRDLPVVAPGGFTIGPKQLTDAVAAMAREQALSRLTRAVHAAGFHLANPDGNGELIVVREDVGRHNALDKIAGHLAANGIDPSQGFLTITSRVSVELIQKAAMMGSTLIAAVSAPTALAVAEATRAGITLVAVTRGEEFEIFTHPERIEGAAEAARNAARQTLAGEGETHAA